MSNDVYWCLMPIHSFQLCWFDLIFRRSYSPNQELDTLICTWSTRLATVENVHDLLNQRVQPDCKKAGCFPKLYVTAYMYSIRTYLPIGRQSSSNLPLLGSKNLKPPVRHLVNTIKYHAPFSERLVVIFHLSHPSDDRPKRPWSPRLLLHCRGTYKEESMPKPMDMPAKAPTTDCIKPNRRNLGKLLQVFFNEEKWQIKNSKYSLNIDVSVRVWEVGLFLGRVWEVGLFLGCSGVSGLGTFEFWCCIMSSQWQRTICGNNRDHKLSILQIQSIPSLALFKRWGA